jgi:hypothetical protein
MDSRPPGVEYVPTAEYVPFLYVLADGLVESSWFVELGLRVVMVWSGGVAVLSLSKPVATVAKAMSAITIMAAIAGGSLFVISIGHLLGVS